MESKRRASGARVETVEGMITLGTYALAVTGVSTNKAEYVSGLCN